MVAFLIHDLHIKSRQVSNVILTSHIPLEIQENGFIIAAKRTTQFIHNMCPIHIYGCENISSTIPSPSAFSNYNKRPNNYRGRHVN